MVRFLITHFKGISHKGYLIVLEQNLEPFIEQIQVCKGDRFIIK